MTQCGFKQRFSQKNFWNVKSNQLLDRNWLQKIWFFCHFLSFLVYIYKIRNKDENLEYSYKRKKRLFMSIHIRESPMLNSLRHQILLI